tara:strand:+ start:143 stop:808 length:666 start_codon:yes stop_codon:yes gene_type:complete
MDIDGLGESLISQFIKEGLVKNIADIYDLTSEKLLSLDRMQEKSAANILESIDRSKDRPFEAVIYSLGIRHVGLETARLLANDFINLDTLLAATQETLLEVPGVGEIVAKAILDWFSDENNIEILNRLRDAGLTFIQTESNPVAPRMQGTRFAITGSLESMSRLQLESRIRRLGGTIASSISASVDYLILGRSPGSKLAKAEQLSIKILTEEDVIDMLNNP